MENHSRRDFKAKYSSKTLIKMMDKVLRIVYNQSKCPSYLNTKMICKMERPLDQDLIWIIILIRRLVPIRGKARVVVRAHCDLRMSIG